MNLTKFSACSRPSETGLTAPAIAITATSTVAASEIRRTMSAAIQRQSRNGNRRLMRGCASRLALRRRFAG